MIYINKKPDFDIKIDRKQGNSLVFNFYNNSQYSVNLSELRGINNEKCAYKSQKVGIKCPAYFNTQFSLHGDVETFKTIISFLLIIKIIETDTEIIRKIDLSKKEIKILQQK